MKKNLIAVILTFACFMVFTVSAQENHDGKGTLSKNLKEFHKRNSLPNIFQKIKTSRQIRIAYFGGSITAAENGWRELTFDWFRLNFPQTAFYQINAAIGGTGSNLGVFRIEQDVLKHKPDLIFIEFAVNDGGLPREKILRSMEGIIRKCWNDNPYTDLCFVYTAVEAHVKNLVEGKMNPSVIAMEELADYYGIPSIHMGIEVARLFADNKLILSGDPNENERIIVFTKDHTHPLAESGHPLYASIVVKYLDKMKHKTGDFKHILREPYIKDNWEKARMMNLSGTEKTGIWEKLPSDNKFVLQFSKFFPEIYKATPGSTLRFNFSGRVLVLYDLMGPGTGMLNVTIDGKERKVNRFDGYSTYYRLGMAILADDLEDGNHTAEITVLDGGINKKDIILEDRVSAFLEHPEEFAETNWYVGNILVVDK